jgi:hypothetical protein
MCVLNCLIAFSLFPLNPLTQIIAGKGLRDTYRAPFLVTREGLKALRPTRTDYAAGSVSHELWFLLDQCWSVDPQLRPTMGEILGSPAFGITQKKESWTVPRLKLMPFVSRPRFVLSDRFN